MADHAWDLRLPGTPPSFNKVGHSGNRWAWSREVKKWKGYCMIGLLEARVPKTLAFVRASAVCHFTTNRKRDEGNYRTILEKALGDALQLGWLDDDDPDHFEFGRVRFGEKSNPPLTVVRLECDLK